MCVVDTANFIWEAYVLRFVEGYLHRSNMLTNIRESLEALNAEALYEIKKLLRSRCSETMLSAVDLLECCLKDESLGSTYPLREFMLEEDMVGFLCDAMSTNSWPLLERLTYVLELLSDSDKMLLEGHAVVAVEAAQRRAHFLALMVSSKSAECESALRAILRLVSTLLERWRSVLRSAQCASNLCPPQGLLSTLRLVLDARCASPPTTLCVANMLYSLLCVVSVGGEPGDPTGLAVTIASCVRAVSSALQGLLHPGDNQGGDQGDGLDEEERNSTAEWACGILSAIAARITSVRAACEKLSDVECDDALRTMERLEAEMQQVMLDKCLPIVVKTARARIESSDEESVVLGLDELYERGPAQPGMTWVLLDALVTSLEHGKDAVALADTLACQDFLWLLPALHRTERSDAALNLLCSMLAHLAAELVGGQDGQLLLADSLPAYVLSLPHGPSAQRVPASVLKMVWVSFAVNCVLATDCMTEAARAASCRLTQLLVDADVRGTLAAAFTAHPCLLYWAFQASAVSARMQQVVLELWLSQVSQGEASDEDAVGIAAPVLEIVLTQRQAVHPLLPPPEATFPSAPPNELELSLSPLFPFAGHATLLGDARFAQAVLSAASDEDVQVCATALSLLRHLEEDNALLKAPVVQAATPLEVGTLLLAVCSGDLQVASAGVLLLLEVLKPKQHPFLILEDDAEMLQSLYFMLQNQALKVRGKPEDSDAVWRALAGLMSRSPTLCQQPWNHVLIKLNLKQAPLFQLSDDFVSFLMEWLRHVAPAEQPPEPTPRRPMPTMLTETAIEIASALAEAVPDFQMGTVGRGIADALLRVTANLPPNLMSSVKGLATK
ncbi:uncharacterized protein LOC117644747 [Thrips palmi]|uniref:Uncharacterized protein LOC117644747 n=1 Tax=Thrips palmi TaxID=161013 RepID=A0A6P8Z112_THRPL|nr:uncharacterized protein LOC117644747 [Thrips palmi]